MDSDTKTLELHTPMHDFRHYTTFLFYGTDDTTLAKGWAAASMHCPSHG